MAYSLYEYKKKAASSCKKGNLMIADRKMTTPDGPRSPWLGFVKFLFITLLFLMFFLLARSMVIHHFFSGGRDNRRDTTTLP
jgi:hypothetical protein